MQIVVRQREGHGIEDRKPRILRHPRFARRRVAGNVYSPEVSGSLQYAGAHLNACLFVVLEDCGAVKAALDTKLHAVPQRSRIQILVDDIMPGLADLDPQSPPSLQLERAVDANVRWTMRQILDSTEEKVAPAEDAKGSSAGSMISRRVACGSFSAKWITTI